jgi:hypothetical protein
MQRPSDSPQIRRYHSTGLLFPTLSEEHNIGDWLDRSSQSENSSREDMTSHTDDSSVDGTVSSVGESTWDLIDEGSVASEDVSYIPRTTSASASEGLESIHVPQPSPAKASDVRSASTDDSDEEDLVSDQIMSEPPHSPQATPVALYAQETDTPVYGMESSYTQELMGTIHLEDVSEVDPRLGIKVVSAQACTFDMNFGREELKRRHAGKYVIPLSGKIHMGLKDGGLEVRDTFKLLYHGPKEMKSAITQKIGSALAANPRRPLLNDGPASSRVTVVPISSFMDESSPEVVMIESGGFDMIIEECISARPNESEGVTLEVESGNTIEYHINRSDDSHKLEVLAPTGVPDLGIIYFPQTSAASNRLSEELTRSFVCTQQFFLDCGIPYYVISDTIWLDQPQIPVIGPYRLVPHRSTELLVDGKRQTWTLPIDITSFLALDASQLHQNLVALKSSAANPDSAFLNVSVPFAAEFGNGIRWISKQTRPLANKMRHFDLKTWITVTLVFLAMLFIPLLGSFYPGQSALGLRGGSEFTETMPLNQAALSKLGMTKRQFDIQMKSSAPSLASLLAAETQHFTSLSQPARKKESVGINYKGDAQSRSRDLLVRVIGDSNILIRSFKPSSGSKNLNFETRRNGKILPHQLQKLDDEYSILEIPSVDAYGQIEIRIWTTSKPKYNETFEIDLGIPWFKVKGWKEFAGIAADSAIREMQTLQRGVSHTFKRGGIAVDDLRRSEALAEALKKVSVSMGDLERAVHSGSTKLLRRSIRRAIKAQSQFSRLIRKAQRATLKQSDRVLEKQARLNIELKELMHVMSDRLFDQQVRFERVIKMLQQMAKSQRFHQLYERQLRRAQKKLLHAWWKVRGSPA